MMIKYLKYVNKLIYLSITIVLTIINCKQKNYPSYPLVILQPAKPTLFSPSNGEYDVSLNTTIKWNSATGVEWYRLQVSLSQNFDSLLIDQDEIRDLSFTSNKLLNNKRHFYRVQAANSGGYGKWSDTWHFNTIDTFLDIITFKRTFGGSENDLAYSVLQTEDRGYIIVGKSGSFGSQEAWIIKTDENGNEMWDKRFSGEVYSISKTDDGGFILGGRYALLIKLDANGNEEWSRTFGGDYFDRAVCVQKTQDGGYILAGMTTNLGNINAWLIKADVDGNYSWSKSYGGVISSRAFSVRQTNDGGYILVGELGYDAFLLKTDESGNQIWLKTYDFNNLEWATSVEQTFDGGYIISVNSGQDIVTYASSTYALLIKADNEGNQIWTKSFSLGQGSGGEKFGYYCSSVQQTDFGGYIATGNTYSKTGTSDVDLWIVRIDEQANIIWEKTYGINGYNKDEEGTDVAQTYDGGFIITGMTSSLGAGDSDIWLIKTNKNGNVIFEEQYQ